MPHVIRILRLTLSDDLVPLPEGTRRSWQVAEDMLAREIVQPVETTLRVIWPESSLPDLVERWLQRYEPDIVSLKVSPYWFTYESVPLRIQRHVPVIGPRLAHAGLRAADTSWLAQNPVFRTARRTTRRVIGGETHFTPDQVLAVMEDCIRRILRREGVILLVRGPLEPTDDEGGANARLRTERKRDAVHLALKRLCADLHIHYSGADSVRAVPRGPDQLHLSPEGHAEKGREEGTALIDAWRHAHGDPSSALYYELAAARNSP